MELIRYGTIIICVITLLMYCTAAAANANNIGSYFALFLLSVAIHFIMSFSVSLIERREHQEEKIKTDFLPFIRRLLQFNTKPFEKQINILEQRYGENVQTIIKKYRTKEENWQQHYAAIKEYPWEKKRDLVRLLFQLAIAEDGIRNDEWNFLMTVIRNIGFNKKWIDHFTYHYYSLRTEFDDKEEEHTTKIETGTTSTLLPYLRVLGLDETATADDIRKAYHQKALEYHPDLLKNANQTKVCEKQMVMINEAYKKLTGSQMGGK